MHNEMNGLFNSQVQQWLSTLKSGLKSIVIVGKDKYSLDQAALQIRDAWLSEAINSLDEFDATNYPLLIEHLNELVTQKSSAVAGQPAAENSPIALWVIHSAQDFNPEQLLLLGQMLIHLPGLNLRMVLLFLGTTAPAVWESATRGQTKTYTFNPESTANGEMKPDSFTHPVDSITTSQDQIIRSKHFQSNNIQAIGRKLNPITLTKPIFIAVIFFMIGWELSRWNTSTSPKQELSIETPSEVKPVAMQVRPAIITESNPNTASSSEAIPTHTQPGREMTRPIKEEKAAITQVEINKNNKPLQALQQDIEWFNNLSSEHYVIAHGTFRKLDNAEKLRAKYSKLSNSRIIPVLVSKRIAYTVITGPFKNKYRAGNNLKKLGWSSDAKVLSVIHTKRLILAARKSLLQLN